MRNLDRLREFHDTIDGEMPDGPTIPTADVLALRRALIAEEAAEVLAAIDRLVADGTNEALAELAHELADLLYVTYGTFVVTGIDADAVMAEVHAANMRKRHGPRRADGKQLKPEGWRGPDVYGVIFGEDGGAGRFR